MKPSTACSVKGRGDRQGRTSCLSSVVCNAAIKEFLFSEPRPPPGNSPPRYASLVSTRTGIGDVRPLVDRLIEANLQPLVWGSDWPHLAIAAPMVNDSALVSVACDWLGDAAMGERVLASNPFALYWRE